MLLWLSFSNLGLPGLLHFDGIITSDFIVGGSYVDLFRRWSVFDASYDCNTEITMNYTCFICIKKNLKLNNNQTSPSRGKVSYNHEFNYDFIYYCLV